MEEYIIDWEECPYAKRTYYEYDTGYDSPAEDCYYYYGKVTASTNVHVFVTIK